MIAGEVCARWSTSPSIPVITPKSVQRKVAKVVDSFKKKHAHHHRMASSYQTELDTLLYVPSKSISELERSICPQYQSDYNFLLGQTQFPQVGRIAPVFDTADVAQRERAQKRKEDRESYYEHSGPRSQLRPKTYTLQSTLKTQDMIYTY